jgi:hypothetical protein
VLAVSIADVTMRVPMLSRQPLAASSMRLTEAWRVDYQSDSSPFLLFHLTAARSMLGAGGPMRQSALNCECAGLHNLGPVPAEGAGFQYAERLLLHSHISICVPVCPIRTYTARSVDVTTGCRRSHGMACHRTCGTWPVIALASSGQEHCRSCNRSGDRLAAEWNGPCHLDNSASVLP